VILTGFSRGAIACNYIGLHDAEIAKLWLECPLPPEDPQAHAQLAARIKTPLALGESYRTRYELRPFFEQKVFKWLQPDLGRCGITEAIEWAGLARDSAIEIVPHVSIAMGPQIAAALHLAAATPNCPLVEYNPTVLETANRYLQEPIAMNGSNYILPTRPGLGSDPAASDPPI
jgi:galactonate dehydratase